MIKTIDISSATKHAAKFTAEVTNPSDLKNIGQDLEVESNEYTSGLPVETEAEYKYSYELLIYREKLT